MTEGAVRRFRRAIRLFERLLAGGLKDSSGCCGVTLAQCHALLEVEELGAATAGVLAGRLQLDKSTLSRTVEGLVAIGLVTRSTHPGDRRAVVLGLSDRGAQVCRRINSSNDRLFGKVLASLPDREAAASLVAFERLAAALAQTMKGSPACDSGSRRANSRTTGRPRARRAKP